MIQLPLVCARQTWDGSKNGCAILGDCGFTTAEMPKCAKFKAVPAPAPKRAALCAHLGRNVGTVECASCSLKADAPVKIPLHSCGVYGKCTIGKPVPGTACCAGSIVNGRLTPCPSYATEVHSMKWSYGVTTCPSRLQTLLPRTLASLAAGGFERPWLFCDGPYLGAHDVAGVTQRTAPTKVFGNWVLALWELYVRNPVAERYAVFQDDVLVYRNLRQYLELCKYPDTGYWNCYTEPRNEAYVKGSGWQPSAQNGYGALALVFSRRAVLQLLAADHFVMKPIPADMTQAASQAAGILYRGEHAVDGGIVTSFMQAGWKEYIHNPSLVQHTGHISSFRPADFPPSATFRGPDFDALQLLPKP